MQVPTGQVPTVGDMVTYVMQSKRFVPALVVRTYSADLVNLVVFGDADDGKEFTAGSALKMHVQRYPLENRQEGDYPKAGTWFKPVS